MDDLSPKVIRLFWYGVAFIATGCLALIFSGKPSEVIRTLYMIWPVSLIAIGCLLLWLSARALRRDWEKPAAPYDENEAIQRKLEVLDDLNIRGAISNEELERRRAILVAAALGKAPPATSTGKATPSPDATAVAQADVTRVASPDSTRMGMDEE